MFEDGVPAAFAEKRFVSDQHIGRLQLARLKFGEEPIGLGKTAHQ